MQLEKEISKRSNGQCELCGAADDLHIYIPSPKKGDSSDEAAHICGTCNDQLTEAVDVQANHWRCLNDSMWSEIPAVKVIAYRMLSKLKSEGWPADLLDMIYLEDDVLEWAKEGVEDESEEKIIHRDCNGVQLNIGDSVVVIKDLKVSGSSLVAKRGTAVRNISLVYDNAEQIEGKVEGQTVVLLTKYLKK
ncbi:MAG: PhnA domain-containing protein [Crocinitomicaceae bacterium]|nr:PhnA domain-containing protein [Crocinitomicaceae bacterium]